MRHVLPHECVVHRFAFWHSHGSSNRLRAGYVGLSGREG